MEYGNSTKALGRVLGNILQFYAIRNTLKFRSENISEKSLDMLMEDIDRLNSEQFLNPCVAITTPININSIIHKNLLSLVYLTTVNDKNLLEVLAATLVSLYHTKILFVLANGRDLLALFEWCWLHGMVNVVAYILPDNQLFTYLRFPVFQIIGINQNHLQSFFPEKLKDLHGFAIKSPVITDINRVFKYKTRTGRIKYGGYIAKLVFAFIKKHNATFVKYKLNIPSGEIDFLTLNSLVENRTVDFSIHITPKLSENVEETQYVIKQNTCICLPTSVLPRYHYFDEPFRTSVWIILVLLLFLFMVLKIVSHILYGPKCSVFEALLEVIRLVTQQPLLKFQELGSKALSFLTVTMLLKSLILCCLYRSVVTSFLIKLIENPRISTWEDLKRSNVKVLINRVIYNELPNMTEYLPKEYHGVFTTSNDTELTSKKLSVMDTSLGYLLGEDHTRIQTKQQVRIPRLIFYTTGLCTASEMYGFPLKKYSPIRQILDRTIRQVLETGLLKKWEDDTFNECIEGKILYYPKFRGDFFEPLTVNDYRLIWITFFSSLSLSAFIFFWEISKRIKILK
ncbi:unnamed protein product [Hermetia illucens]|uniref:Ionotropic receptor n=1 Tax=Hermetia illucens TaxID=343691 RepID=A0A7R8UHL9_HERIL|nr:unnamed protein product [Hermetia illucens]